MLFSSTRKKGTNAATTALRTMIGAAQRASGIPSGFYESPYVLGFLHSTAGCWAKFGTNGKITGLDLGLALFDSFTSTTNLNGKGLVGRANELILESDPDFSRGSYDATVHFLYLTKNLKDESSNPLINQVIDAAERLASSGDFDSDVRSAVAFLLLQNTFLNEVTLMQEGITNA